jgi:hypothetical protein
MLGRIVRTLLMLGVLMVATTSAHAAHVSCGETITADTRLDSDLVDCPGDGLVVAARGITVDLGGHTVDGAGDGTGVRWDGPPGDRSPVVVRNGTVTGFAFGLAVEGDDDGGWVTLQVRRARVVANDQASACDFAACDFFDSTVARNREGMSYLFASGTLLRNTIADNVSYAIGMSFTGNRIRHNRIVRNGQGFGSSETAPDIADNLFADNRGPAIRLEFTGGDGTIARNRMVRNGTGIDFGFQGGVDLVSRNVIADSRGPGVSLDEDGGSTFAANTIVRNQGNGIEALDTYPGSSRIVGNDISGNAESGVLLDPGTSDGGFGDIAVRDNRLQGNGVDGLAIRHQDRAVEIVGNRADRNGDDGIEVAPHPTGVAQVEWSPDGALLAFIGSEGVFVMRPDGSGVRRIAEAAHQIGWSPDGARLAYAADRSLHTVSPDGTGDVEVIADYPVHSFDWSPDGARFAFGGGWYRDVHVVDSDGGNLRPLTYEGTSELYPTWAPDGERLAFSSDMDGDEDIYLIRADGTERTRLTNDAGSEGYPDWAPQGDLIAFLRDSRELTTIRPDGSGATHVASDVRTFSWSPSGIRLASDAGLAVVLHSPDGSSSSTLTAGGPEEGRPVWSPDESRLAFRFSTDAAGGLGTVRADGSDYRLFYPGVTRVASNRADRNGDLGIEAVPGVDGGGNRALHNGDPRQCVGVVCR